MCTPTFAQVGGRDLQPEDLAALKQELQAAVDRVEAEEQRQAESQQPQTLDEVALLEGKLNEALVELQRRREELSNRDEGTTG